MSYVRTAVVLYLIDLSYSIVVVLDWSELRHYSTAILHCSGIQRFSSTWLVDWSLTSTCVVETMQGFWARGVLIVIVRNRA